MKILIKDNNNNQTNINLGITEKNKLTYKSLINIRIKRVDMAGILSILKHLSLLGDAFNSIEI